MPSKTIETRLHTTKDGSLNLSVDVDVADADVDVVVTVTPVRQTTLARTAGR